MFKLTKGLGARTGGLGVGRAMWAIAMGSLVIAPQAVVAMCPIISFYITDANDLVQIKGKIYDNAGNETKVSCTPDNADGRYRAYTGGTSSPPARAFEQIPWDCPGLDWELDAPTGANGADVQIVKNGAQTNACAFVGARDSFTYPYGWYISSVLKFDPVTGFKSEKGTLIYNLTSGSFIGKFKVVARP